VTNSTKQIKVEERQTSNIKEQSLSKLICLIRGGLFYLILLCIFYYNLFEIDITYEEIRNVLSCDEVIYCCFNCTRRTVYRVFQNCFLIQDLVVHKSIHSKRCNSIWLYKECKIRKYYPIANITEKFDLIQRELI